MRRKIKVILDFDGTLTAEERQAPALAQESLDTLANEMNLAPQAVLEQTYHSTRARLIANPHRYWWEVNGLVASYCTEGAFILNTTTLQTMLRENVEYAAQLATHFPNAEYDPVVDCTNWLFHRHTAEMQPLFRPSARAVLVQLIAHPDRIPVVLTNSLGDKVARQLESLALDDEIAILGDTRQYDMAPHWTHLFEHPELGPIQIWPVSTRYRMDLRRPVYYDALIREGTNSSQLAVVADSLSLPGALPLMMGIPFFLLRTPYTPKWCTRAVAAHPLGRVLNELGDLPAALDSVG